MVSSATIPKAIAKTRMLEGFKSNPPRPISPSRRTSGTRLGTTASKPSHTDRNIHDRASHTSTIEKAMPGTKREMSCSQRTVVNLTVPVAVARPVGGGWLCSRSSTRAVRGDSTWEPSSFTRTII